MGQVSMIQLSFSEVLDRSTCEACAAAVEYTGTEGFFGEYKSNGVVSICVATCSDAKKLVEGGSIVWSSGAISKDTAVSKVLLCINHYRKKKGLINT